MCKSDDYEEIGRDLGKAITESKYPNLYLSLFIVIPISIGMGIIYHM